MRELTRPCVHCGICLPRCPTYRVLKDEADSPRGRILLMDAFAEGRVAADAVRPHLDRCIGCRACETACPSGVPYGELLERGRAATGGASTRARFFLQHVLPRPWLVRTLATLGRWARRVPPREPVPPWPNPPASPRARISLHAGCVTPHLFPALQCQAAHVFTRLGFAVDESPHQGCCGALHRHAGLAHDFDHDGHDTMVSVAAGCSATDGLVDACALLLDALPIAGARVAPVKVAYDAPCHLLHAQGVDAAPLLDVIEGVERVALPDADECCGAGGLYMALEPDLARRVREKKLDAIDRSGAAVVATPNPGCMLWLWRGLRERGSDVRVVHPVSLLYDALTWT